jgi:hypothetical protein
LFIEELKYIDTAVFQHAVWSALTPATTFFLFVFVILLHLCVLVCACVRAGLLIGPARLIMRINKLINNIIIIITTIVVPNFTDQWLGFLCGRSWVGI